MSEIEVPAEGESNEADQLFLDRVFERAFAAISEGGDVAADDLLEGREALRPRVAELIRVARDLAVGRSDALPSVPGYTILGELGRGGMGVVYLARQERLGGRSVALKVLPASVALSARARERFRNEIRAIARLRHPNIVAVHDVVDSGDVEAFAMEWVEGRSLADVIDAASRDGEAPNHPELVCRIGLAIARALAAVHERGFLHRDVKPSNILLRDDGTPLLTDFGLVRDTDTDADNGSMFASLSGSFVGTLAYAAPEQIRGDRAIDARADVYALGATLYHALALKAPFEGKTTGAILREVEAGRLPPIRRFNSRLSVDVQTIVAKAMDPDAARRYASAGELADDLERLLALKPIAARPAGVLTRTWKLARRNRRALAGAFLGGTVALAAAVALAAYLVLVPRWAKEHVTAARLALLDPVHVDMIFITEFIRLPVNSVDQEIPEATARRALESYRAALRLRPGDDVVRMEHDTLRLVFDFARGTTPAPEPSDDLKRISPLTCEVARSLPLSDPEKSGLPDSIRLRAASAPDLRALGFLYYLAGRIDEAVAAWAELARRSDPDPFVDGMLGLVFLVRDQAALAYPRLLKVCEEFPGVGFLTVYLADAAVRCGDLERAGRLLEAARGMPLLDPTGGLDRVKADLMAARGETRLAWRRYREHRTGFGRYRMGQSFAREGRWGAAVRAHATGILDMPRSERAARAFVAAAERWWSEVGDAERATLVRRSLDSAPKPKRTLDFVLSTYVRSKAVLRDRGEDDSAPSGPSHSAGASLSALAERMRVLDDRHWSMLRMYPSFARRLQVMAWLSEDPLPLESLSRRCWRAWLWCASLFARSVAPDPARARAASGTFEGIGDFPGGTWSQVGALSADGSTAVGNGESDGRVVALRWRHGEGLSRLEGGGSDSVESGSVAVSADGSVIVGYRYRPDAFGGRQQIAFRWSAAGGAVDLACPPGASRYWTSAMSADGVHVFGGAATRRSTEAAVRWSGESGFVDMSLGTVTITDASFDGTILAGFVRGNPAYPSRACRVVSGEIVDVSGSAKSGTIGSEFTSVSRDGSLAVGGAWTATGAEAIRYSPSTGMTGLGDLPGGAVASRAIVVSDGGELAGGWGTSFFGREAVIWHADGRIERAVDFLSRRGVRVPLGFFLESVVGIAVVGGRVTLAGDGFDPSGHREGWVASGSVAP